MRELYQKLDADFVHADDRGCLTQLVHEGFSQFNILETRKGVTRGGHYHKVSKEAFFVVAGSVRVTFKYEDEEQTTLFSKGDFFLIPPGVIHSLDFPEDCILAAMYDIPVEKKDGTKDIFAEEDA